MDSKTIPSSSTTAKPRLLDQVRQAIRPRHYSPRTEETYVGWIKRFIFFHNKRHPAEISLFVWESCISGSSRSSRSNRFSRSRRFDDP
ncbi:MAG: phage integrase N-terminal SAM-like domain-containing protein [Candidatus Omnitrophica bacterium]|nr:phage integrase N-terminal SAM-like domain-containing protein [Candidatus Omnitrophota bacterium]